MENNTYQMLGLISGGISLFAYGLYVYQIWWGSTRPSKSAWWILSVVWTVMLFSSISLAPGDTFSEKWLSVTNRWIQISYIISSFAIAISSIWRGTNEKWGWSDYLCAIAAGVSLVFYLYIKDPALSLVLSIVADFFGIIPVVQHSWVKPEEEDLPAWAIESIAGIIGLFAVSTWVLSFESASNWASPIYITIMNVVITLIIGRRYFKKSIS